MLFSFMFGITEDYMYLVVSCISHDNYLCYFLLVDDQSGQSWGVVYYVVWCSTSIL